MSRSEAIVLCLAVSAAALPSCVLVSSTTNTPSRDAGVDAFRPPRDANVDSSHRPVLTREQATRGLLESIGTNVALPTYRELATEAAALEAATSTYAASRTDENRAAAREAWIRLMTVVERAELLQLGPAGMAVEEILGGQGLRDRIYSFPVNRCLVNVVVERGTYEDLEALAAEPAYARGLAAVEYLLFEESTEHGCDPGASTRVDDARWEAFGPDGVRDRQAASAHANARLVRQAADALVTAWSPDGGDFAGQLARAGAGGSVYPTTQAALNGIYWAMFYVDRAVKDMKLAVPTGISDLCGEDSCPELLESRWAGRSSEHLAANLLGLQQLFLGGPAGTEAIGFDDLLWSIGQGALAVDIEAAIAAALERASALPPVRPATFDEHEAELEAMYRDVRAITDLIKMEFASVLAFTPPPGAGEDND